MKKIIIFLLFSTLIHLPLNCYAYSADVVNYINNGSQKCKLKDYKGAIQDYDKALSISPISYEAYYNRGACRYFLRDFNGAINDFSMVILLNPNYSNAYSYRGLCKIQLKNYSDAIKDCDKALKINPNDYRASYYKSQCEYQLKNYMGYMSDIEQAKKNSNSLKIKHNPNSDLDINSYMTELQKTIKANWNPPRGEESKRIVLLFKIEKDGTLHDLKVYKSSGSPSADEAALIAVNTSAPFNPLPKNFNDKFAKIQFTFDYNVFQHKENGIWVKNKAQ